MGNCYTTAGTQDNEENLERKTGPIKRDHRAQRQNAENEEDYQPDLLSATDEDSFVSDVVAKLAAFVRGLKDSYPSFYSEKVGDIIAQLGGPHDLASLTRDPTVKLTTLKYVAARVSDVDGSLYEGLWNEEANFSEGLGVRVLADGTIYEGYFRGGKEGWNGRQITNCEGEVYVGDFQDGMRHGEGVLTLEDGTTYNGGWKNNLKSGHGVERWTDGAEYDGNFKDDLKEGQGYFKWQDGSNYQGEFKRNLIEGSGLYRWFDGRIYEGQWSNNMMHGRGVFTWEDGRKYEGEYVNDKKEGRGKFTWPDCRVYDGQWHEGRQHGEGTYTTQDGRQRQGEWADGKRQKWIGQVTGGAADSKFSTVTGHNEGSDIGV